jgi:hypothetical protein
MEQRAGVAAWGYDSQRAKKVDFVILSKWSCGREVNEGGIEEKV